MGAGCLDAGRSSVRKKMHGTQIHEVKETDLGVRVRERENTSYAYNPF